MRKLFLVLALSLTTLNAYAYDLRMDADAIVNSQQVTATVCNDGDTMLACSVIAIGVFPNGQSIYWNQPARLAPGQCAYSVVNAGYYASFEDGYGYAYCNYVY